MSLTLLTFHSCIKLKYYRTEFLLFLKKKKKNMAANSIIVYRCVFGADLETQITN